MGGGLMQLVAYGAQDIYLTGNPQITFFKVVYRRHTNFSMETIQQTLQGASKLSTSEQSGTVTISRNGDLLSDVFVSTDAAMTKGDQLVREVDLEIGGQLIDRQTYEWVQIWNELTTPGAKQDAYKYMTKSHGVSASANGRSGMAIYPLKFWFCRNPGLALPLIALQYHEVKLKFTFSSISQVNTIGTPSVVVWADYIYLDTDERRRFAQVSHEYLIEQVQMQEGNPHNKTSFKLNFNHPVKEIIWTSLSFDNRYEKARIELNGHDRFAPQEEEYFQLLHPYKYHTAIPHQNRSSLYKASLNLNEGSFRVAEATDGTTSPGANNLYVMSINSPATGITRPGIIAGAGGTGAVSAFNLSGENVISGLSVEPEYVMFGFSTEHMKHDLQINDTIDLELSGTAAKFSHTTVKVTNYQRNVSGNTTFVMFNIGILNELGDDEEVHTAGIFKIENMVIRATSDALTSSMNDRINVYSFALKPEEHQPSGTCNFSRIDNAKLVFDAMNYDSSATEEGELHGEAGSASGFNIYAHNYNVLRIMSGMGGLAYSN